MRRHIKTIFKFTLVFGLLFYLAKQGFISLEDTRKAFTQYEFIVPGAILQLTGILLTVLRWHYLLRAQSIFPKRRRTLELSFLGFFFNMTLPGAVSGDAVKAYYIGKDFPGKGANAFSSVLIDRVIGVSGMLVLSAAALIISSRVNWGGALSENIRMAVILTGISVLVFYAYLFLIRDHQDPLLKTFDFLEKKFSKTGSFKRIYEGIRIYRAHPKTVFSSVLFTLLIQSMNVLAFIYYAHALGQPHLSALAVFIIVPLGMIISAIPILPAGIGTGHAAFLALFHLIGSTKGADLFNIFLVFQFLTGMIGGLVYLRFKSSLSEITHQSLSEGR
jgi:glycosyltransferase 2 family protein